MCSYVPHRSKYVFNFQYRQEVVSPDHFDDPQCWRFFEPTAAIEECLAIVQSALDNHDQAKSNRPPGKRRSEPLGLRGVYP